MTAERYVVAGRAPHYTFVGYQHQQHERDRVDELLLDLAVCCWDRDR